MTPLIDVMLVLLVIFILTAPLMAPALRLDLPRAAAAQPATPAQVALVTVDAQGQIYWQSQPMTLPDLQAAFRQLARQDARAEVQLRADAAVPYGQVVAVLDAAHLAGLSRIGFVARP